jgi:hypothetical protein
MTFYRTLVQPQSEPEVIQVAPLLQSQAYPVKQ